MPGSFPTPRLPLKTRPIPQFLQALLVVLAVIGAIVAVSWAQPSGIPATVAWAKSGQSLALLEPLHPDFPVETVRLAGIIAPAIGQTPWDQDSRDCLEAQVNRQRVRVVPTETSPDIYDRVWAEVWQGPQLVNAALLEQGCALLDETALAHQPHQQTLIYAQEQARILGQGIWNPLNPLRQHPRAFSSSPPSSPGE